MSAPSRRTTSPWCASTAPSSSHVWPLVSKVSPVSQQLETTGGFTLPERLTVHLDDLGSDDRCALDPADHVLHRDVPILDLDKTVRNETTGGSFVDQADAQPSERVTFKLVVDPQNSNSTLTSVVVRDTLPNKVSFVSGTLNVNGVQTSEGAFFSSGLSVSNVSPGSQLTITFQADVASTSQFTAGTCEILTNSATVTAATNLSDSDTALVKVCKQAPVKEPGTPSNRPF